MERYEKYKDSGIEWIGLTPEFWNIGKLKTILSLNAGGVWGDDPRDDGSDKIVLRSTEQTVDGQWNIIEPATRDLGSVSNLNSFRIMPDDLVVTKSSGSASHIGKTTIADGSFAGGEFYCSNFMQRLRLVGGSFPKFYWYVLNSDLAREQYVYFQNSTSGLGNLNSGVLGEVLVPIPAKREQQAIADFLDKKTAEIDGIVSETERSIELLREYRKSIISEAVTKGLDPNAPMKDSGVEWIGEIPERWQVKPLRYIGSCANGISKGGEYFGSGHPFVSYGNVYRDELKRPELFGLVQSTEKERDVYSLKRGDVLFTRTTENIEEVALSATVLEDIDGGTFAGFLIRMRPYEDAGLVPEFAQYYFKAEKHREFFNKEMMLVTRASLGQDLLKKLPVLLPPTDEQVAVAVYLDAKTAEIDALIADKEKQVELLKEYRKSLISEAVTGKFKVPGVK